MVRHPFAAALLVSLPFSALAAETTSGPSLAEVFEGATPEQAQLRAALVDASWDIPSEVLLRIQGVDQTDRERFEEMLPALIDPQTSGVRLPFVDLAVFSPGPDAVIERTYNSRDAGASEFGRGWSWAFGTRLVRDVEGGFVLRDGFGGEIVFKAAGANRWVAPMLGQQLELKSGKYLRTSTTEGMAERFDKNGFLVERLDAGGRKVTVNRNQQGHVVSIVAANGRKLEVKSDKSGRIVSIADPAGRTAEYSYEEGRLTRSTVHGLETAYAYDADGLLTAVTFPDAVKLAVRYNPAGWVDEVRIGDRVVKSSFAWNKEKPAVHSATIQNGAQTTRYQFDEEAGRAEILGPSGEKQTLAVDLKLRSVKQSVLGEDRNLYEYDAIGRVTRVRGTDGVLTFAYGPRTVRTMDLTLEGGAKLVALFDDTGNPVKLQQGATTIEVAWVNGQPVETKVNGRVARRSEYDRHGDLVSVQDASGRVVRIRYDAAGTVTAIERVGASLLEIAPQAGAFLPKIRVTRNHPAGAKREVLALPEMAFLYGDLASARPSKRASLDSIPGVKLAGLGNLPIPAAAAAPVLAGCFEQLFLCEVGYSFKCFGTKLLEDVSPIGSPLKFNPKTGEWEFDPSDMIWDQLKESWAEFGKAMSKEIATNGTGFWKSAAAKARRAMAIGKGLYRAFKPLIKKLALPVKLLLAVKTAYDCATEVSENSTTLCNPDRVCAEPKPGEKPAGRPSDPYDAIFIMP